MVDCCLFELIIAQLFVRNYSVCACIRALNHSPRNKMAESGWSAHTCYRERTKQISKEHQTRYTVDVSICPSEVVARHCKTRQTSVTKNSNKDNIITRDAHPLTNRMEYNGISGAGCVCRWAMGGYIVPSMYCLPRGSGPHSQVACGLGAGGAHNRRGGRGRMKMVCVSI